MVLKGINRRGNESTCVKISDCEVGFNKSLIKMEWHNRSVS